MVNIYTHNSIEKLQQRIEEKRIELVNLAAKNGLTSNNVVKCSQELDQLIYKILTFDGNGKHGELPREIMMFV